MTNLPPEAIHAIDQVLAEAAELGLVRATGFDTKGHTIYVCDDLDALRAYVEGKQR
jgi:hypothetical protein